MKICVLQPDYSTSKVDYQYFDPPRNLANLLPNDTVQHVFLNKLTTYSQLKALRKENFDIFVNLCEGYLEWEVPSIDVIHSLEMLNLPYTGPTPQLYDPPKSLMKYVAWGEGVKIPASKLVKTLQNVDEITKNLRFPLFIKPEKAGDSLGIDDRSKVTNKQELLEKVAELLIEFDEILVEEYIEGREFTVLVAANPNQTCQVFKPIEYIFPENFSFKTYALKTSELHPDCNVPCEDMAIEQELKHAAEKIFKAFNGEGYARLDFRLNDKNELFFLEINFTCSVFYKDGYEGSADFILKFDGIGQQGFLKKIIGEGIARFGRKQKKYEVRQNAISGFGIYARINIAKNEVIFNGEGRSQRIITKRFAIENWTPEAQQNFARYAYPISSEVFVLWDENPAEWAPQNHSCDANTTFDGLNVVANRLIKTGEELTLDYSTLLDENAQSFECQCKSVNCKGIIEGIKGNSITYREKKQHQNQGKS
jgi:D-alanine-D-alanine ligase